jgi:radical SAM superfamily enzyme YgiQ (UPF0313 family)
LFLSCTIFFVYSLGLGKKNICGKIEAMKIAIAYPPLESSKGVPLLSQNRQFQWFHDPTFIYPVVPAQAATMLEKAGHEVVWLDGIAEGWTYQGWLKKVKKEKPDLVMIETKTPVIKKHWKIIDQIKKLQTSNLKPQAVLVGDHVTALPEESFQNSKVDFVLTGGDYDFLLLNLVNHLEKGEKLEPGIWYRSLPTSEVEGTRRRRGDTSEVKNTGRFQLNHDLNKLPPIDRELSRWKLYAYDNGNYKYLPGTYIMAGRDCWWRRNGGCKFCSWTTIYPKWRVRSVESVLDEVGELVEKYKVKEIMDDTGTFPVGEWLREFCRGMIKRGYNKKINFDCNMRFGALSKKDYELMAKAGFRFLLYGLESANQKTLDRLNKGTDVSKIEKELEMVKQVNRQTGGHLEPHVTCMVGYPWESKQEAKATVAMTKRLFEKGLINTLQATVVIPYPGTQLFKECQENGWLKTLDWDDYDMTKPVMKTKMRDGEVMAITRGIYTSFMTPKFIIKKVLSIRNWEDVKFMLRAGKKVVGHLLDFRRK